jgi:hypothetical protein
MFWSPKMKKLDGEDYKKMVAGATVIARDKYGDKVLKLQDGLIVKLFRLKRRLSSAVIWPYARRFERGARKLHEVQIPTVEVLAVFRIKSLERDIVIYRPLEGESLRDALKQRKNQERLLTGFSAFLSRLHDQGVYFRGIHFGNVIVLPTNDFGLIDVSEIHVSTSPLKISKRVRNFRPLLRYSEDREVILGFGLESFLSCYLDNSNLSIDSRQSFLQRFKRHCFDPLLKKE